MSTLGIIGAGNVGAGLATAASRAGHNVLITNTAPQSERLAAVAAAAGATAASARVALGADLVVLALPYRAAVDFATAHAPDLADHIVIDATNPLTEDFSSLETFTGSPAAVEIASAAPQARVVKAFNTVFASTYTHEQLAAAGVYVPVASDDLAAADAVIDFARSLGFDAVHVGDLSTAGFLEATVMTLIHLGFFQGHGADLGLRLVRG